MFIFGVSKLKIKLELRLPLEVLRVSDFLVDKHVDYISTVHINCNNCDDSVSDEWGQILSDSLNEFLDAEEDVVQVIFHS